MDDTGKLFGISTCFLLRTRFASYEIFSLALKVTHKHVVQPVRATIGTYAKLAMFP
jgi:hypothetical protein